MRPHDQGTREPWELQWLCLLQRPLDLASVDLASVDLGSPDQPLKFLRLNFPLSVFRLFVLLALASSLSFQL